MKLFYVLLLSIFTLQTANAQSYVGLWHGYVTAFDVPDNASYTLDVKTHTGGIITGKAYVNVPKYPITEGILDFIGTVTGKQVKITELSIVKSIVGIQKHYICIKNLNLTFSAQQNTNYLKGLWTGNIFDGNDCRPGEVYLRRLLPEEIDSIPPSVKTEIIKNPSAAINFLNTKLGKPTIIDVNSRVITLELRDYLKEDNDTVTVYFNRRQIINHLQIERKPHVRKIRLDREAGLNEIIIYADNLGLIPPNTSSLVVRDDFGSQRVRIESSKQISAVIYLRYVPPQRRYQYPNEPPPAAMRSPSPYY